MQFTPGQLRSAVGLSKETLRHWKRVLPVFSNRNGHAPTFTLGDVLASAVMRSVTENCGVRVGHLAEVSQAIFDICNTQAWVKLTNAFLIVDFAKRECRLSRDPSDIPLDNTIVVCALDPIIEHLQSELLPSGTQNRQGHLYLPPTEVARGPAADRGAK